MAEYSTSPQRRLIQKVQRLFLILGLVLLGIYFAALIDGRVHSRLSLWAFEAAQESIPDRHELPADATGAGESVDFSLWSVKRIEAYKASLRTKLDSPIALLNIPRLQLTAPILEGTDDLTLNRGLGRISGTAPLGGDGNVGIAGHRDGFFRVLKDVAPGDSIEIATPQSQDLYVVDRIDIVDPGNVRVLEPSEVAGVTLITCYPFYFIGDAPHRYVVHASLKQRWLRLRSNTIAPLNPVAPKEK